MEITGKKLFQIYDINITACVVLQKMSDRMILQKDLIV
jgi:hypothetical protein